MLIISRSLPTGITTMDVVSPPTWPAKNWHEFEVFGHQCGAPLPWGGNKAIGDGMVGLAHPSKLSSGAMAAALFVGTRGRLLHFGQ
jgi:hypothetical protein